MGNLLVILYIGIYCLILDVTEPQERGWGSGMLQTFYFFGLAVNPVLGSFLADRLGFTTALLICAGLQGMGLLGALLFMPETHQEARANADRIRAAPFSVARLGAALSGWFGSLSTGWLPKNREILSANYLYMLTLFIGDGIIMSTIIIFLKQRFGDRIQLDGMLLPPTGWSKIAV